MDDNFSDFNIYDQEVGFDVDAERFNTDPIQEKGADGKPIRFAWAAGQRGVGELKTSSKGQPYFAVSLMGKAIAPGTSYDGRAVFVDENTMRFPDRNGKIRPSLVDEWLESVGQPAPNPCSPKRLRDHVLQVLSSEPQGEAFQMQWQVRVPDPNKINEKTGKPNWTVLKHPKGMSKFRQRTDGSFDPTVEVDGVEYTAQCKVMHFTAPKGGA